MSSAEKACQSFGLAAKTLKKQKIVAQKIGGRSEKLHQICTRYWSMDREMTGPLQVSWRRPYANS
jgi:hypothetical protein